MPNRLADEKSPYLLQHRDNPVDWYPWGDEAFERARAEDRPIFLSVGYSTCHWCHVMERESFEDDDTAAVMNELFVNVKVDREEHPDVDQIYMGAVQRMTGQGGWPMSVFLTPDLKPFFAGTYFPPETRWGRPGFREILRRCSQAWEKQPDALVAQGEEITRVLGLSSSAGSDEEPGLELVQGAVDELARSFDSQYGGFGAAPKFPRSMTLMLLLRRRASAGDEDGGKLAMVERTLEMMWRGGLYDHVGGGFARYSTDEEWLVPHFEKMLYDNALLALAYAEAWQVTGREDHRTVATETLDWALAEMTHPDGGFFSAQDADSEGEEGKFYVWTPAEVEEVLGEKDAAVFSVVYGLDAGANFEGKNILHLPRTLERAAELFRTTASELTQRLRSMRRKLYDAREARIHPGLDDKVLTSWNGLMIAAMARVGAAFGESRFVDAAVRAARFIDECVTDGNDLRRRWRDGDARLGGTLEDHAFFAWGLVELFEATGDPHWLARAQAVAEAMVSRFHDASEGGFFLADESTPHLIVRLKESYDGATPSGNSVAVLVLARLAHWLGRSDWSDLAEHTLRAAVPDLKRFPGAHPFLLCALERCFGASTEIVICRGTDDAEGPAMLAETRRRFLPHAAVVVVRDDEHREALARLVPWVADKVAAAGRTTAYVCRDQTCARPVERAADMVFPG